MRSKIYLIIALFLFTTNSFAQSGVILGNVTDASNNQVLIGATISIKNSKIKILSDVDGVYRVSHLDVGQYTLEVTYIGYTSKEVSDITVVNNNAVNLNITLEPQQDITIQSVVVTTTSARREILNSILTTRRNAAVVSDAISADMIKRSPDKSIGEVLKRVSGTSVQDNKFVIIRGMSDRYNEAILNGALLPSTEPDRKAFDFDIFPSDIVDNVTIIKSALPEYPSSFAGGLIQVNLKDVPDKNFFSVKAGLGYNTITTGKPYYHDQKGNTDFLGLDDGTRALPDNFPNQKKYNGSTSLQQNKYEKLLSNDWGIERDGSTPLNTSLQLSAGFNSIDKSGYPKFGGVFGLSYNSTYKYSKNTLRDYGYANQLKDSIDTGPAFYDFTDSIYTHSILESVLANLSFKLNATNKFYFNNLVAISSGNTTDIRNGQARSLVGGDFDNSYYAYAHYFQSNVIYNMQFGGEHYLPKLKLKIKWQGYYTKFNRNEPDYRQMIYYKPFEDDPYYAYISSPTLFTTLTGGLRLFFQTKDAGGGTNVDLNKAFKFLKQNQALKGGFFYYHDERTRDGRFLRNDMPAYQPGLAVLPPSQIFDPSNFNSTKGFVTTDFARPDWIYYTGSIRQIGSYLMLDNKFTDKLRLAWGVRYENYNSEIGSYVANRNRLKRVDSIFNDFLPSANFIYSVLPKANIRLSYSRTLARPLYRELASTLYYDFFQNATFYGGSLTETKIDNYEARWEQYFSNAQYYSVSGFYKKFHNPIEPKIVIHGSDSKTITWINIPSAECFGAEFEARKNLDFISPVLSNLFLYANASLIKSTAFVKGNGSDTANRPMQGQSPYIVNASIQYAGNKSGLNFYLQYNIVGERISLIGDVQDPYVWEKPHATLDFKASKTFLKNGLIELSLADILHKNDVLFWDVNNNKKYDANYPDVLIQSKSFGMTATLSVGYRF